VEAVEEDHHHVVRHGRHRPIVHHGESPGPAETPLRLGADNDTVNGTLPWYVARASGLVAWTVLATSVAWGLLMTSRALRGRVRNTWLVVLHRWLGGLAVVLTAVHVVAIMLDTYVHFGVASVLVPLASHWHPVAVAWGVASLYTLVAVELTSLLRRHIPNAV